MNKTVFAALGCVASLALAQAAIAQTAAPTTVAIATTPSAPVIANAQPGNIVRAGAPIALKMSEPLTTEGKKLRVGQRFQLEVAEAVMLNGQVVIPAGSPATGEVIDVRNKGMWGKSGRIGARVLYVRANGRQIRLTGSLDDKGVTGTAGVVAAVALIPVAGFFTTGTSARVPLGAPVNAFLDEDVTVEFAPTTVSPMVVPAPTAPEATPAAEPAPTAVAAAK